MTQDYKHFPRVIRPAISDRQANQLFVVVLIVLVLVTMSIAGKEDMSAQVVIDKQQVLEHVKQVVSNDEQAALHFYGERVRP